MSVLTIKIQSLEDEKAGKLIIEGKSHKVEEAQHLTIGILEAGMESGRTSISFISHLKDGTHVIAQASAAHFEMLIGAVRGAVQRFENPNKEMTMDEALKTMEAEAMAMLKATVDKLSDEQRHQLFKQYCVHCGSKNIYCTCHRDD